MTTRHPGRRPLTPYARDLFGDVPITEADVLAWLSHVGINPDSPRAVWYVRAYRVAEKITAAKLDGRFWSLSPAPADSPGLRIRPQIVKRR